MKDNKKMNKYIFDLAIVFDDRKQIVNRMAVIKSISENHAFVIAYEACAEEILKKGFDGFNSITAQYVLVEKNGEYQKDLKCIPYKYDPEKIALAVALDSANNA